MKTLLRENTKHSLAEENEKEEMSGVEKFIIKWFLILAASYFTAHFIVYLIIKTGLVK